MAPLVFTATIMRAIKAEATEATRNFISTEQYTRFIRAI